MKFTLKDNEGFIIKGNQNAVNKEIDLLNIDSSISDISTALTNKADLYIVNITAGVDPLSILAAAPQLTNITADKRCGELWTARWEGKRVIAKLDVSYGQYFSFQGTLPIDYIPTLDSISFSGVCILGDNRFLGINLQCINGYDLGHDDYDEWSGIIKPLAYTTDLENYAHDASYNSSSKKILLLGHNGVDGTVGTLAEIDTTQFPQTIKAGSVAGKLYRDNVGGSGNFSISGNSGCIPNLTAGTFLVSIYAKSETQNYTFTFNFGSGNTYSLSTTNGELNDLRTITISSAATFSGSVSSGSVAAGTILYVVMYNYLTPVQTIGTAAVTNRYADLDGLPVIPSAPGTLNTNNTTAQTVSGSEALSGAIKLHKVAKTGTYSDLIGTPSIPSASDISTWNNKADVSYVNDNRFKIYLGTSDGPAGIYDKEATAETFPTVEYDDNGVTKTKPVTGIVVGIKYSVSNTYKTAGATYTLNVNNTGAWPMYYNNAELASSTSANTLVAGYANRYTYYIFNGTQWVFISASYDTNSTYTNVALGHGWTGTSSNGATATARTASLSSYALTTGGMVSVKFSTDVAAGATLNINSKGAKAIYGPDGTALKAGVIKAGDVVTFIYSTYYRIISIQRGYGGYETPVVTVAGGSVTQAMFPNTLYMIGTSSTPCTSLTFTLTAGNATVANYYHAIVVTGANMTFSKPNTVVLGGGKSLPTFTAGGTFEFSILENIMYFEYTGA